MGKKSGVNHGFIGGQSGMGKSNLLNNIITQVAELYSPLNLVLQLMDLKGTGGTEFKKYKKHPNVEKLVLTSKPYFSLKILQEFYNEYLERDELFDLEKVNVNDIYEFNKKFPSDKLPFKLLIIDEIQVLVNNKDYNISKEANHIIHKIATECRNGGMHLLLSTQSLKDVDLNDGILQQLNLRIAFKLKSDSHLILGTGNDAAHFLKRYSIIYNSKGGNSIEDNTVVRTTEIPYETISSRISETLNKSNALKPIIYDKNSKTQSTEPLYNIEKNIIFEDEVPENYNLEIQDIDENISPDDF